MKSLGRRATGQRLERMKASPQWRDGKFANVGIQPLDGKREAMPLREFLCPSQVRKPLAPLPVRDPSGTWAKTPETGLRTTWLGHSTVVIEIAGRRILTDPVWTDRASPARRIGPKRFQPAPVPLADLPDVDLILLSHDHYDHLDYATIRTLSGTRIPFVAPLGVGAHLEAWGIAEERITELDWWDECRPFDDELLITSTPAQHFSGRSPTSGNHTLWSSYVLQSDARAVYFGADSGLMSGFSEIAARFPSFDLVMLEVGAFHPAWADIHLGPRNALRALETLGGGPLLPIHWGVFDLSTHRWDQPIEMLWRDSEEAGARVLTPHLGEAFEPELFPAGSDGWWRDIARLHGPDVSEQSEELMTPPPPAD